jgi:hypothetical protein
LVEAPGIFFSVRNDDISVIFRTRLNLEPVLGRFFCDKLNAKDCITPSLLLFEPSTNMFRKIGGCAGIFLKSFVDGLSQTKRKKVPFIYLFATNRLQETATFFTKIGNMFLKNGGDFSRQEVTISPRPLELNQI